MPARWHIPCAAALAELPATGDERYAVVLEHGTLEVGLYAPQGRDEQEPHERDEVYVVLRGSGRFVNGEQRVRFGAGDVLFVPAGQPHRFEDFSEEFAAWAIFYGPPGGEQPPVA